MKSMDRVHRQIGQKRADRAEVPDPKPKPSKVVGAHLATRLRRVHDTAECMAGVAVFLEEAKPAEIRLLSDMLAEWQNWGGSLRAGNFFGAVARAVLDNDTASQLQAWPKDRRKVAWAYDRVQQKG